MIVGDVVLWDSQDQSEVRIPREQWNSLEEEIFFYKNDIPKLINRLKFLRVVGDAPIVLEHDLPTEIRTKIFLPMGSMEKLVALGVATKKTVEVKIDSANG